jgi:hypothetical protein
MSESYLDCGVEVRPLEAQDDARVQDVRASQRFEPEGVSTAVRNAGFYRRGKMQAVKVLDVGTGGISFESSQAMSTGQKVELSIDTPVKNGISATGRVKYCIRWASNFRIGVEFTEISPADQRVLTKEFFESPR